MEIKVKQLGSLPVAQARIERFVQMRRSCIVDDGIERYGFVRVVGFAFISLSLRRQAFNNIQHLEEASFCMDPSLCFWSFEHGSGLGI